MVDMKKGLLIVYSGPSGVGKSTILHEVLKDESLNLEFSVSMTTRLPREGEIDGKDYFFVSKETFKKAIEEDKFLEHARYVGNYYGTPRDQVEFLLRIGKNVLIEVEAQGVGSILLNLPEAVSFFVMPENEEQLIHQISSLYKDDEASVKLRINKAKLEMQLAPLFRHVVYNNDPDKAVSEIKKVVLEEMAKRKAE